jgi:hypothetical protein
MKISRASVNLFLSLVLLTMTFPSGAASPKEASLHAIGIRTFRAIADGDPPYVASIADLEGIYVGSDEVRHTGRLFQK